MDSVGLGVCTATLKRARTAGHHVALIAPQTPIRRLLARTGIARAYPVYRSADQALTHGAAPATPPPEALFTTSRPPLPTPRPIAPPKNPTPHTPHPTSAGDQDCSATISPMASHAPAEHLEQELAVLLRRARGLSAHLARQLHPGLEAEAYGLLLRMSQDRPTRAGDLVAFTGVAKPTISRQLGALERLGLIERSRDPQDARAQIITLTPAGTAQLEQVTQARRAYVRELLRGWEESDVALFAALLERLNTTLTQDVVQDSCGGDAGRERTAAVTVGPIH